jgi:V/A-type H+/Na+-transporting ATPase subunit G/H
MKVEVLKRIKDTEQGYTAMINGAKAAKEKRIAAARLEADSRVIRAEAEIEEYKKKRLAEAREEIGRKREAIQRKGEEHAAALRNRGTSNLDRSVAFLVKRFREQLHVPS